MINSEVLVQKPTDYASRLAEYYKREMNQLDRWHQQLRERDQQEEKAKTTNTVVDFVEKFGEVLPKAAKTVKAIRQEQEKNVYQDLAGHGLGAEHSGMMAKIRELDKAERAELNNYEAFSERIGNIKDKGAREYLLSLHGGKAIWAQKYLAGKQSLLLEPLFKEAINTDEAVQTGWQKVAGASVGERQAFKRNWASTKFGDEFIHEGQLFETVSENLESWLKSTSTKETAVITKLLANKEASDLEKEIVQYATNNNPNIAGKKITSTILAKAAEFQGLELNGQIEQREGGLYIDGRLIEGASIEDSHIRKASKWVANTLITAGYKGELTRSELDHIFTAYIKHPAGNSIEVLFDADTRAKLYKAADSGTALRMSIAKNARKAENENKVDRMVEEIASNPEAWTEEKGEALVNHLILNDADPTLIRRAELIVDNNQSTIAYNKEKDEWLPRLAKGLHSKSSSTMKTKIDEIANVTFKKEVEKFFEKHDTARNEIEFDTLADGYIKQYVGTPELIALMDEGAFPGTAGDVQIHLKQKAVELVTKHINDGLTGTELSVALKNDLQEYWTSNGGGQSEADGHTGMFVQNAQGQFDQFNPIQKQLAEKSKAAREARQEPTVQDIKAWNKQVSNAFFNPKIGGYTRKNSMQDLLLTAESLIDGADLGGMVMNKAYSAELIHKAAILKIGPGALFEYQVSALVNSDDPKHKAIVKKWELDKVKMPETEKEFWEAFDKDIHPWLAPTTKHIKSAIQQQGWKNLSTKTKKLAAFALLNNDFEAREYVFPGGLPTISYDNDKHDIGMYPEVKREFNQKESNLEAGVSEWGLNEDESLRKQPSAKEQLRRLKRNKNKADNLNITTM